MLKLTSFSNLALFTAAFALGACAVTVTNTTSDGPADGAATATATAEPTATATATPTVTATATATATASAPKVCTKMGCQDGLDIELKWDKDALTAAKYKFELEADGKKGSCEVRYPLACDKPTTPSCTGDLKVELKAECAVVPPSTAKVMTVGPLHIDGAPAAVSLKVMRDKVSMGKFDLKPALTPFSPNGPDCAPTCKQGKEQVCIGKCGK